MNRIIKAISFLFVVFILIFSSNSYAYAASGLSITNWSIVSKLNVDGSLNITEDITFKFQSKYNGVFRDIYLNGISGIDNISVYEVEKASVIPYSIVTNAKNGDSNVYQLIKNSSYNEIKIYSPSNQGEKTFRFQYRVLDAGVKYNDTGELFYNYIGIENKTDIEHLSIKLTIPMAGDIKAWAHAPSNAVFSKQGVDFYLEADNIKSENIVAFRTIFPKDNISLAKKYVNKDALVTINDEENSYTQELKKLEKRKMLLKTMSDYGVVILLSISVLALALSARKYKRKEKYEPDKYFDIFPENCTPAVMRMLYTGYVTNNDILASLLDLSRRGYLKLESSTDTFGKKRYSDFLIIREKPQDDILLEHEKYLMKWLIDDIGDGNRVMLSEISEFSKASIKKFTKSFTGWRALVKMEAEKRGYYDKGGKKPGIMLILFSIAEFILGFIFVVLGSNFAIVCNFLGILIFIYGIKLIYRRSDYGNIQLQRWKRFKKYYSENEGSIPMESYMAYAVALGLDKSTFEKYRVKYTDGTYNNSEYFWIYWYFTMCGSDNKNSFNESINSAFGYSTTNSSGGSSSGGSGGGGAGGF